MSQYVVLLRGVNVGKGNRVPMAEFKQLLNQLGHRNVHTLLNSGNAIFQADTGTEAELAAAIAEALSARFDIKTPVIVKSRAALERIIAENPVSVPENEHSQFLVAFGADSAALQSLETLTKLSNAGEELLINEIAGYLHCRVGILDSAIAKAMLGKAGRSVTTRNWATVLKLAALFERTA